MQPIKPVRIDPAPSRLAYRVQRLWLTPSFRLFVRAILPMVIVASGVGWYLSGADRIERFKSAIFELRSNIEHRPEFMVNLMRLDNVSNEVADDVREITALDFPISSFDLDLDALRRRIEELDAVQHAELVVRQGGVLDVQIQERIPALVWRGRDRLELLDKSGHRVAGLETRSNRTDLPLIIGDGADGATAEALKLFAVAAPISQRLRGLARMGNRRWDVVLDNGQRIMLPAAHAAQALERVLAIHKADDLLSRDISVVDMRNPNRPTLRLRDSAVEFQQAPLRANDKKGAL